MEKKLYNVEVMRIGHGFATIGVEAESQEQAGKLALDQAGSHIYYTAHADYKLSSEFEERALEEEETGGDYILKKGHTAWINVDGLSVKVARNLSGELQIEVFSCYKETEDPLAAITLHIRR